jgi:hypothetical protein
MPHLVQEQEVQQRPVLPGEYMYIYIYIREYMYIIYILTGDHVHGETDRRWRPIYIVYNIHDIHMIMRMIMSSYPSVYIKSIIISIYDVHVKDVIHHHR